MNRIKIIRNSLAFKEHAIMHTTFQLAVLIVWEVGKLVLCVRAFFFIRKLYVTSCRYFHIFKFHIGYTFIEYVLLVLTAT